jgi:hypothetical protein
MNDAAVARTRLTDRGHMAEADRANARVTRCEQELWRARQSVRLADTTLRRALRTAAAAEEDLSDASRRLDRVGARPWENVERTEHRDLPSLTKGR